MKPLISVIVPVYNSEKFLKDCIESIIKQTYHNIEIILVDDGSEDRSKEICDEYAKKDNRIIVIHKLNGGNISARKAGVKIARGEYIGFVDSDDWIDSDMYESLLNESRNQTIDIVSSGYINEDLETSTEIRASIQSGIYSSQEDMKFIRENMIFYKTTRNQGITYSLWNKLFRKSMLEEVILNIDDECTYAEDAACVFLFLIKCSSVSIIDKTPYHYRRHLESLIHSQDISYLIGINKIYILLRHEFEKLEDCKILMGKLEIFICIQILKGINYHIGFNQDITIPLYGLPLKHIKPDSKIILYGAGKVGISYYEQIKKENYCEIVCWIDQKYESYRKKGLEVFSLSSINDVEYDYVIIASRYKEVADNIKEELIKRDIDEEKIIWYEPLLLV